MTMAGASWNCPHCGERILRSAASCPACRRHLRFEAVTSVKPTRAPVCPLSVDGSIRHPGNEVSWEYSVLVEIHDGNGDMLARRVVQVGPLRPGDSRKFTLKVEVLVPEASTLAARQ